MKTNVKFFTLLIIAIVILNLNKTDKILKDNFYFYSKEIISFFYHEKNKIYNSPFFVNFDKVKMLISENKRLKKENQKLLNEILKIESKEKENRELKKLLKFELQKEFDLKLAKVISADLDGFILIDKGKKNGIKIGMPVINSEKVFYGEIIEVYNHFSKVILINNKKAVVPAQTAKKGIKGIIKGEENFLIFDLIKKDDKIKTGDIIITSALSEIFPKGLLIGRVKKIEKNDLDPFLKAEVEPFIDQNLETVFLIKL